MKYKEMPICVINMCIVEIRTNVDKTDNLILNKQF
jgi:hypothetical protein